ncbi:TonB family protein [Mucilaginibacter defluvii]|uniref:Carboxypeptidase-like regulatory domain-containing protein n=1 Tax=Mucilaginibacter defluvii TaxID=1196019 RepID=A0ABP9FMN9_9SPHI
MSKPADITKQIQKYLNGELDARAMHQLECEAQNDPFLMDALEGYSKAGANQQANLNDIAGRLQQRTDKGKVRSMLVWRLSAAASVIVLLGAIGLWLYNDKPKINDKALAKQVEIVKSPEMVVTNTPKKPDSALQNLAEKPKESKSPYIAAARKAKPLRQRASSTVAEPAPEPNAAITDTATRKGASLEEVIVTSYYPQAKRSYTSASVTTIKSNDLKQKTITGKVTDELKQPIPGVAVTVRDKDIATQTDANGNFSLTVPEKSTLNFGYLGYESKKVKVKNQDSLMIAMEPSQKALSEVVVVGYGSKHKIKEAHPINGWDDYNEYLKENAVSPDGKKGTVKLTFVVNADGSLTDFEITKSLSDETDQQAIALVKDGPKWMADSSGQPKKVKLSIKFRAE